MSMALHLTGSVTSKKLNYLIIDATIHKINVCVRASSMPNEKIFCVKSEAILFSVLFLSFVLSKILHLQHQNKMDAHSMLQCYYIAVLYWKVVLLDNSWLHPIWDSYSRCLSPAWELFHTRSVISWSDQSRFSPPYQYFTTPNKHFKKMSLLFINSRLTKHDYFVCLTPFPLLL